MDYRKRQAQGKARRAEYLRKVDTADRVASMLRGIALGCLFIFVMALVAGVDSVADYLFLYAVLILGGASASVAHYFFFRAYQSRYSKSRQQRFWDLFNTELSK